MSSSRNRISTCPEAHQQTPARGPDGRPAGRRREPPGHRPPALRCPSAPARSTAVGHQPAHTGTGWPPPSETASAPPFSIPHMVTQPGALRLFPLSFRFHKKHPPRKFQVWNLMREGCLSCLSFLPQGTAARKHGTESFTSWSRKSGPPWWTRPTW